MPGQDCRDAVDRGEDTKNKMYRETRYDLDQIYGIMQIFGLKLGNIVDPEGAYTLKDLIWQLGAALNRNSPVRLDRRLSSS
jgi:hypothetical protein